MPPQPQPRIDIVRAPDYISLVAGARSYSDEEVEAIFRRALERQAEREDGYARDELVAAAKEIGLDEEAIDRAHRELAIEASEEDIRATVTQRQRRRWARHVIAYLVIAGGFLALHGLGLVGVAAIWLAVLWGMGIAFHTASTVTGPSEKAIERERTRRNRKARRAENARARREAKRRRKAEQHRRREEAKRRPRIDDELERAIEQGVSMLLNAAARKMREAAVQRPPSGEFARYVADKKRGGARAAETRGPRVRVAPRAEEDPAEEALSEERAQEDSRARPRRRGR